MESRARRIRLPPRAEYRFELEAGEVLSMRFVQDAISGHYGDAEVFGAPLVGGAQERWYTFGNEAKAAISSWGGAEIEIVGTASTEYMADEPSPLYTYGANLHLAAERARIRAREQLRTGKSLIDSLAAQDVATRTEPPSYENMNVSSPSEFYRAAGQGPRIMVVGPESAGKTSLIKFLANYALRSPAIASVEEGQDAQILSRAAPDEEEEEGEEEEQVKPDEAKVMGDITGWWPMVLNLDPNAGAVPVPGCISAIPLSPTPMNCLPSPSPALPYGVTLQTSGALPPAASTVESVVPLVQWLGKENVRENEAHSHRVVDWLAHSVEKRLVKDLRARMSGLLLDMPGVVTGDSRTRYSFIQYCVRAFKVDVLVVLGHEKLNLELTKIFSANADAPQIVKVPKSGGAVDVDDLYKQKVQDLQIRSYFYGMGVPKPQESGLANEDGAPHENSHVFPSHMEPLGGVPTLNPYSFTIPLDLLEIYRVGQDRIAPSSALPIGAERAMDGLQVVKLDPVNSASDLSSLLHSVLVLVEPPRGGGEPGKPDSECERTEDELLGASLVGLVHVAEVDQARRKMTVLSPRPGKLPSKTALIGVCNK